MGSYVHKNVSVSFYVFSGSVSLIYTFKNSLYNIVCCSSDYQSPTELTGRAIVIGGQTSDMHVTAKLEPWQTYFHKSVTN